MDTQFNRAIADLTATVTGNQPSAHDSRNNNQRKLAARRAVEEHLERKRMRQMLGEENGYFDLR